MRFGHWIFPLVVILTGFSFWRLLRIYRPDMRVQWILWGGACGAFVLSGLAPVSRATAGDLRLLGVFLFGLGVFFSLGQYGQRRRRNDARVADSPSR